MVLTVYSQAKAEKKDTSSTIRQISSVFFSMKHGNDKGYSSSAIFSFNNGDKNNIVSIDISTLPFIKIYYVTFKLGIYSI